MVRPNKRLGQHFLRDRSVIEKTLRALELTADDTVLEIGPGEGVLTEALAEHAGRVVAVELDRGLVAGLRLTMPENVELVHGDALSVDLDALGPFTKIAGNLPYQISSPLTFRVLDMAFERAVFLYQFEFAARLVADVTSPHYGRLSVARAFRARGELLSKVRPGAFHPPPKVMSALVRLVPHEIPPFHVGEVRVFDDVVRLLFTQRRKTLRKSLSNNAPALGLGRMGTEEAGLLLEAAQVTVDRVEELDPAGYGRLALAVQEAMAHAQGRAREGAADGV